MMQYGEVPNLPVLHQFPDNLKVVVLPVEGVSDIMDLDQNRQILEKDASSTTHCSYTTSWSPDSGYSGDDTPSIGDRTPTSTAPSLVIIEEPETSYRFRYKKESPKPHGPLKGRSSIGKSPKNSNGPIVKLKNFDGEGIIRVWLHCQTEEEGPSPHCLVWVGKHDVQDEPRDIPINRANNFTACFDKLNILHVVVNDEPYQKNYARKKRGLATPGSEYIKNPPEANYFDKSEIKREWKEMEKNICTLRFEAFEKRGGKYVFVDSILSEPIKNKKSPKTNGPRIVKSSHVQGTCLGGTEILIFTEKLIKDIRIIFFDEEGWQEDAVFKETDIHKQVGVAFKTPPYKDRDITEDKIVWFKIHRNTDHEESDDQCFRYQPREDNLSFLLDYPVKRKRPQLLRDDPMLSDVVSHFQPESSMDPLFFDTLSSDQISVEDEVNTGDLLADSIPNLGAYLQNICKDSVPTLQGPSIATDPVNEAELLANIARRLQISILTSDTATFITLLKTPNIANYKCMNQTPLHLAVKHQKPWMISELLKAGANVYGLENIESNTALHLAIKLSHLTCLQQLLQTATPRAVFNKDGDDPVLFATRSGCKGALELLLMKGFLPSIENVKNGDTPLHVAVENYLRTGQSDIIDLLLKYGACASEYNNAGRTPLHYAIAAQDDALVEKLIPHSNADDYDDEEDELTSRMELLKLTNKESIKTNVQSFLSVSEGEEKPDDPVSTAEPFLALDGDVELSKKVATRLRCSSLIPFLVNAEKQSQVLLNYLQRKHDLPAAVSLLNDALAKESSDQ